MVSSFGISALEAIRKIKGFENAVIAGGFIRDHILGLDFKDVDIFVPCSNANTFVQSFFDASEKKEVETVRDNSLYTTSTYTSSTLSFTLPSWNSTSSKKKVPPRNVQEIKIDKFSDWKFEVSGKNGYLKDTLYLGKMKCKYAGVIDVEVMCYNLPNNEDFGKKLVKNFSYNIDMVYFDGIDIRQTKEFERDRNNGTATLSRLNSLAELPSAFAKYLRFKEKAPGFSWKCDLIELKADKKKEEKDKKVKIGRPIQDGDIVPEGARWIIDDVPDAPVDWEAAAGALAPGDIWNGDPVEWFEPRR